MEENKINWQIHTDLAVELTENFKEKVEKEGKGEEKRETQKKESGSWTTGEMEVEEGISMEINQKGRLKETVIWVKNEKGEESLGKPQGCYITIEGENLSSLDESYHEKASEMLKQRLKKLLEPYEHILAVGLGNQDVTADSLGPSVVKNLCLTRHLKKEGWMKGGKTISSIAPGVLAQTGMEVGEILKALVKEIKPEVILAVDALAARNSRRLNQTIQICDAGIAPGSGVGNHRMELTEKTLGVKVIAIGVPTVISVPTLVNDAVSPYLKEGEVLSMEGVLHPELADMFVTPKNVDEAVKKISYTISEAINGIVF